MFGSFGYVVGALNDLLSDQLVVRRAEAVLCGLLALSVEPARTRGQQTQRPSHGVGGRPLKEGGKKEDDLKHESVQKCSAIGMAEVWRNKGSVPIVLLTRRTDGLRQKVQSFKLRVPERLIFGLIFI